MHKIPSPKGDPDAPLQALIFDSIYDSYKGVIIFCRVMEGTVKKGTRVRMMATGAEEEVVEVGYFGAGQFITCDELSAGMVAILPPVSKMSAIPVWAIRLQMPSVPVKAPFRL